MGLALRLGIREIEGHNPRDYFDTIGAELYEKPSPFVFDFASHRNTPGFPTAATVDSLGE